MIARYYILQCLRLVRSIHKDILMQARMLNKSAFSYIHPSTRIYVSQESLIEINKSVQIGRNNLIVVDNNEKELKNDKGKDKRKSRLLIHEGVVINEDNNIRVTGVTLTIEEGVRISQNVNIICSNYMDTTAEGYMKWVIKGDMTIGAYSLLGAGCSILPGVSIGKNVTVGAGAVVTRSMPDDSVCVGNPARRIRGR